MRQLILLIILFLILAATSVVWYKFSPSQEESPEARTEESGTRLTELRRLKTLKLDISVLRDPFFESLQLPAEAAGIEQAETSTSTGRTNPFLPF